jgi:hypothetical protein
MKNIETNMKKTKTLVKNPIELLFDDLNLYLKNYTEALKAASPGSRPS